MLSLWSRDQNLSKQKVKAIDFQTVFSSYGCIHQLRLLHSIVWNRFVNSFLNNVGNKSGFFQEQVEIIHVDWSYLQNKQIIFVMIFWVDNIFFRFLDYMYLKET